MDEDVSQMDKTEKYLTSFYFIITTFSTVGYGDMSANNTPEKIFCILVMCLGVTAFAAGTSTLTNLLQSFDQDNSELNQKLEKLNQIQQDYKLPPKLYDNVKKSINSQHKSDTKDIMSLVETLPQDLRDAVTLFIYESTFKQFEFFNNQPISFIAWICPLLKPQVKQEE